MPQAAVEQGDASYLSRVLPRLIIDHSDWSNGDLLTALQSRDDFPGDGSVSQKAIKNAAKRLREKLAKNGFLVDSENPGAKLYPAENLPASSSSPSAPLKCSACESPHPTNRFTCPRCSVDHNRYHVCNVDCQKRFWKKHKAEHDARAEVASEQGLFCVLCHKPWPGVCTYTRRDGEPLPACSEACKEDYRSFEAVDLKLFAYNARYEAANRPSEKARICREMESSEEPYIVAWSTIKRAEINSGFFSLRRQEVEEMAQQLSAHLENMEARTIRPALRRVV